MRNISLLTLIGIFLTSFLAWSGSELPGDVGVITKSQKPVRDSNLGSISTGGSTVQTYTGTMDVNGNPLLTPDGLIRLQIENTRFPTPGDPTKHTCFRAVNPLIIDYENFTYDSTGNLQFAYVVAPNADPAYRVPMYAVKHYIHTDANGYVGGSNKSWNIRETWQINDNSLYCGGLPVLSSGANEVTGQGFDLTSANGQGPVSHMAVAFNADRTGPNPYLSDQNGNEFTGTGQAQYLTYDLMLIGSVGGEPRRTYVKVVNGNDWGNACSNNLVDTLSGSGTFCQWMNDPAQVEGIDYRLLHEDADINSSHPYYAGETNGAYNKRGRLIMGTAYITVRFDVVNGYRKYREIVAAGINHNTFRPLKNATGDLLRGFEPALETTGNLFITHSDRNGLVEGGHGQPGNFGKSYFFRRLAGSFEDPVGTNLHFSTPKDIQAMVDAGYLTIPSGLPGAGLLYRDYYSIMKYKISDPSGEHIYYDESIGTLGGLNNQGASNRYPAAYPWLSMSGNLLYHTGGGHSQTMADLDEAYVFCNTEGCDGNARSSVAVVSPLNTMEIGGETIMPITTPDSQLQEATKTMPRLMAHGFIKDGPWSPEFLLDADARAKMTQLPGDDVFALYMMTADTSTQETPSNSILGAGRGNARMSEDGWHSTTYGEMNLGSSKSDFLFTSDMAYVQAGRSNPGFSNTLTQATWAGNTNLFTFAINETGIHIDHDRFANSAYNGIDITRNSGAYTPYDDPRDRDNLLGAGTTYTRANASKAAFQFDREYQIGRRGQGAFCALSGKIEAVDGPNVPVNSPLRDYTNELSVQLWFKPLQDGPYDLFVNNAVKIRRNAAGKIKVTAYADDPGEIPLPGYTYTVNAFSTGSATNNNWYHLLVNTIIHQGKLYVDLYVNGELNASVSANTPTSILANTNGNTYFCNGGTGADDVPVMIVDEIGVRNRQANPKEIRVAALIAEPGTPNSISLIQDTATYNRIISAKLDPRDFYVPADNPLTTAKIELGKHIFFDQRFSANGDISCASCHNPAAGYSDSLNAVSPGSGGALPPAGSGRHAPPITNLAFHEVEDNFFWDGRAETLREQVVGPLDNPVEHNFSLMQTVELIQTLNADYNTLVTNAFGVPNIQIDGDMIAKALEAFVRSLVVGDSPWDRYMAGYAVNSINTDRGAAVFIENCRGCHNGPSLSNRKFHNVGAYSSADPNFDIGRFAVTGAKADIGAFKTPSLRDLGKRGDKFNHDGQFALSDILDNYEAGGEFDGTDFLVRPFNAADRTALENFLQTAFESNEDGVLQITSPWIGGGDS